MTEQTAADQKAIEPRGKVRAERPGMAPPPNLDPQDPPAGMSDKSSQQSSGISAEKLANGTGDNDRAWTAEELSALIGQHERSLIAYASRMLGGDWQSAQDAVQETFLRLCRERKSKIIDRVRPWLFAVCRSRVIDMQRTTRTHHLDTGEISVADPRPDAAESAIAAESLSNRSSQLAKLVARLSPRQQEVLRLRMQAGLSYREIAEVTGLTISNVGFHLHAAVRALKTALANS